MGSSYCIWWIIAVIHISNPLIQTIHAKTPQSPVQCNESGCTLQNSYGAWGDRKDCIALNITYPTTEEEFRLAVSNAVQNNLKVKVVTKFSHTIPKLACPEGKNTLLISTEKYGSDIQIDAANLAVTADSGVGLRALIDAVENAGFSLVAAPYWEGVSIGGLISTGAHGSSWWGKGGAVHDHVLGLSLIVPASQSEGYAKILRLEAQDPLFNAAKVSLGVLGAISKVSILVFFMKAMLLEKKTNDFLDFCTHKIHDDTLNKRRMMYIQNKKSV
ncbi:putative oxidoreductase [Lupinus albus]|uniref:L-gulonolactone oxidase n=1 Tax=Lupinus albus TaxID=3870 RepID=A0A6A4NBX6_LUPAL|nr:putative oxidoreductase [Lupinus albus]